MCFRVKVVMHWIKEVILAIFHQKCYSWFWKKDCNVHVHRLPLLQKLPGFKEVLRTFLVNNQYLAANKKTAFKILTNQSTARADSPELLHSLCNHCRNEMILLWGPTLNPGASCSIYGQTAHMQSKQSSTEIQNLRNFYLIVTSSTSTIFNGRAELELKVKSYKNILLFYQVYVAVAALDTGFPRFYWL